MVFDPRIGMTPNDWRETEARRKESRRRVHNPHGRETSARTRMIAGTILGLAFLALIAYALLGWTGLIAIPGVTA